MLKSILLYISCYSNCFKKRLLQYNFYFLEVNKMENVYELVSQLEELKQREKDNLLFSAIRSGDWRLVELAIAIGADITARGNTVVSEAVRWGNDMVVSVLLKEGADVSSEYEDSLLFAVSYGFENIVKMLLEAGAKPDVRDGLPLKMANKYGRKKISHLLMEYEAKD